MRSQTRQLIDLNPDAIKIQNNVGMLPFHCILHHRYPIHSLLIQADEGEAAVLELTQFFLQHNDKGAATKRDIDGHLSLLRVNAVNSDSVDLLKLVYNAYPQAIYMMGNDEGMTA